MNPSRQKSQLGRTGYGLTFFFVCFICLFLDQWTKYLVSSRMQIGETVKLSVDFIQITFVRNFGGAFGVLVDVQVVFIAAALLAVGCVYWQFPVICSATGRAGSIVCAAIIAGALGNLCDRIRLGYVIDMLDLKWWPVFNVADICITVGITVTVFGLSRLSFDESPAADEDCESPSAGCDE